MKVRYLNRRPGLYLPHFFPRKSDCGGPSPLSCQFNPLIDFKKREIWCIVINNSYSSNYRFTFQVKKTKTRDNNLLLLGIATSEKNSFPVSGNNIFRSTENIIFFLRNFPVFYGKICFPFLLSLEIFQDTRFRSEFSGLRKMWPS